MKIPVSSAYISGSLFSRAHGRSKAFLRSRKTAILWSPLSVFSSHWFKVFKSAVF